MCLVVSKSSQNIDELKNDLKRIKTEKGINIKENIKDLLEWFQKKESALAVFPTPQNKNEVDIDFNQRDFIINQLKIIQYVTFPEFS